MVKHIMNKIGYTITALLSRTSCAGTYDIQGSSNVSDLDGQKLYLKVTKDGNLTTLDSCDVVHGQFSFSGKVDSAHVARIFMDDKDLSQPVVIEQGNISIKLDNTQQKVSGTPLNDKLNKFWNRFVQIRNQYADIDHEQSAAIMNGQDEAAVNIRLAKKAIKVFEQGDKLLPAVRPGERGSDGLAGHIRQMPVAALPFGKFKPALHGFIAEGLAGA